jgi:long-subunit fatty acid transport protein
MLRRPWPLALVLLAAGVPASAQGPTSLSRSGSGARAAGMAHAFVAVSDDGTAASWNPAGLAQLRNPEFSLVYALHDRALRLTGMRSADGGTAYSNRRFSLSTASVDFASAALPLTLWRRPVTVQVGWQRIYQLAGRQSGDVLRTPVAEPAAEPAVLSVQTEARGDIDRASFSAAVKLTSRLSVGGGFNLWRGAWTERLAFAEPAAGASDMATLHADNRVRGENVSAGLLLTWPRLNVGLVYHSPFWSRYTFRRQIHSSLGPPDVLDGGERARFRFPRLLGLGLAWRPAPRWTVAADLTHDQWTDTLVAGLAGRPEPFNFFDAAAPEFSTTRDTLSFNLGAEHLFLREGSVLPVRVGFGWEPQGGMDPATGDSVDYLMVALGGGYNTNRLKFDAALQYRWAGGRVGEIVSVSTALRGGFERDAFGQAHVREWRLKVSAIYRIPDTDGLKAIVRKVFG